MMSGLRARKWIPIRVFQDQPMVSRVAFGITPYLGWTRVGSDRWNNRSRQLGLGRRSARTVAAAFGFVGARAFENRDPEACRQSNQDGRATRNRARHRHQAHEGPRSRIVANERSRRERRRSRRGRCKDRISGNCHSTTSPGKLFSFPNWLFSSSLRQLAVTIACEFATLVHRVL
jgi:hypothetical protein